MNTSVFLLSLWRLNIMALIIVIALMVFHYVSNGYRLTPRSPLFLAAVVLFILVTFSPLDILGKNYLFSAHMVQHIVFLLIIPPLILTGTDKEFLERLSRKEFFRKTGDVLFFPLVSWLLGVGSMWVMHMPSFMKGLGNSTFLMDTQMIILPVLGWIFIWPVFTPVTFRRLEPLQSSVYLFLACVGCTLLGILITFASPGQFTTVMQNADNDLAEMIRSDWGINDSKDQMIGGLIMWVPACLIYIIIIMIILIRFFTERNPKPETRNNEK